MVRCFPTEAFAACVNLIQHCCSVSGSCLGGLEFPRAVLVHFQLVIIPILTLLVPTSTEKEEL